MRLVLEEVWHVYSPGTAFENPALRGVSLSVEPGEVLGIVGGTGSGKSTLAAHLNLLLRPASGRVLVDGQDASDLKRSELRRRVGLVFQFPEQALFAPSVEEDVAFAPRQMGLGAEEVEERVTAALAILGIDHLARRPPRALSGGEQRRAAIAGILALRPEVLVLDEPTAALDPFSRAELLGVVRRLREEGASVVLVSHDLDEVAEVSDRICVMEGGRVRAEGTPERVFYGEPALAPTTVRVAARVRESAPGLGRPVSYGETLRSLRALIGV